MHHNQGRIEQARECLEAARTRFQEGGSRNFEANALGALANLEGTTGSSARCHELQVAARAAYREIGLMVIVGTSHVNESQVWSDQGAADEALASIRAAEVALGPSPPPIRAAHLMLARGEAHACAGDLAAALACLESAADSGRALSHPYMTLHAEFRLGRLLRQLGEADRARQLLELTRVAAQQSGFSRVSAACGLVLARLALDGGELELAEAALESASSTLGSGLGFESCHWRAVAGRLAGARGDVDVAKRELERCEALLKTLECRGGWLWEAIGELRATALSSGPPPVRGRAPPPSVDRGS